MTLGANIKFTAITNVSYQDEVLIKQITCGFSDES